MTAMSDLFAVDDSISILEKKIQTADKLEKVNLLVRLSKKYENINLRQAVENSNKAIKLATELNYVKGLAEAYLVNANQAVRFDVDDSVLVIKEKAYNLFMSIGEERLAAKALLDMARTTLMLHQYAKTNELVHKSVSMIDGNEDRSSVATSYMILGQLYNIFDLNDLALEYLNNSIQIYENLGEVLQAQKVYVIKNLARLLSKDKSSISDLQYSLSVFKKNGQNLDLIEIYRGMADYYYSFEKRYDFAATYLDTALTLALKMGDNTMHAILLSQYAWLYSLKGDYIKELEYNRSALEVRRKSGFSILFASSNLNMGATFLKLKQYDSTEFYLKRGLELLGDTNSNHYSKRAFNLLYQFYLEKNDLQKALYYRNKEMEVDHNMTLQENSERMYSLKMQLDLAESERNLSILRHEKSTTFNIIIIIVILLLVSGSVYLIITNRIKEKKRFELKREEDSNLIKNNMFSDISLVAPCLMYMYDPINHTITIINDNILKELGYRNTLNDNEEKLFWGLIDKEDDYLFRETLESNEMGINDNPLIVEFKLKDYFGDQRYFRSLNKLVVENELTKTKKILGIAIEVSDYKKYEENNTKQVVLIKGINEFIDQISNLADPKEIYIKTAEKIREITGASIVCISAYDPKELMLNPQHFSIDNQLLQKLNDVLGMKLEKMSFPVTEKMLSEIKSKIINSWDDIHEPTGGLISKQIAVLLKDMFSVREILGLSLVYNEVVIGAMIIIMRNIRLNIEPEILRIYTNIASFILHDLVIKDNIKT